MTILGIHPRARGTVAVLDEPANLVEIHDMPAIEETSGCPTTNAPLLAAIVAKSNALIAYCAFVGARPIEARVAAFAFGRARGVIEAVAGAFGLPIVLLTPPTWKRLANIPTGVEDKDRARARAIARWPAKAQLLARKRDVHGAESALIGWAACSVRAADDLSG